MGIIHTAKKNVLTELVRKKTQLKLEDIIRVEHYERGLTKKEELEVCFLQYEILTGKINEPVIYRSNRKQKKKVNSLI